MDVLNETEEVVSEGVAGKQPRVRELDGEEVYEQDWERIHTGKVNASVYCAVVVRELAGKLVE